MSNLANFRTKIRQVLGDTVGSRYKDDLLDEALRWILAAYGKALPQVKTGKVTISTAGREQSLLDLSGLVTILEVNFPYTSGDETPDPFEAWYFYTRAATPYIHLGGSYVPEAGDLIRVVYTVGHTIEDLDSATATTIPATQEYLFANGAAGKAAMSRGAHLIEAYGSRGSETNKLQTWADQTVKEFLNELSTLKISQALPGWKSGGWQLDQWDEGCQL
jgi:hypothetical protein